MMLGALDSKNLDGEHVFIAIDLFESAYVGENTFMGDDGRDEEANSAFDALFNVHIRKPKTKAYEEFENKVRNYTARPPFNHIINEEYEVRCRYFSDNCRFLFNGSQQVYDIKNNSR